MPSDFCTASGADTRSRRSWAASTVAGGYVEWTGIRGAPTEVVRFEPRFPHQSSTFSVQVEINLSDERLFYFIKVGFDSNLWVRFYWRRKLRTASETIYAVNRTDGLQESRHP